MGEKDEIKFVADFGFFQFKRKIFYFKVREQTFFISYQKRNSSLPIKKHYL